MSSELYENSVQRHVPLYATISANGDKTCDILLSDPGTNCTGKRGNLCSQSFRSILGRPLMKPHVLWRLSSDHRTATRMPYRAAHKMRGEGVLFAMFHSAPLYRLMGIKISDTLKKPELRYHSGNGWKEHVALRMEAAALRSQSIPKERIVTSRN